MNRVLLLVVIVGCGTRPNPEFCDDNSDCKNGAICDLTKNRCTAEPDAATELVPDALAVRCDPSKAFGSPSLVPELSSSLDEGHLSITSNELVVFLYRNPPASMVMAKRVNASATFDFPTTSELDDVFGVTGEEYYAGVAADGLSMYFHRSTQSGAAINYASRASAGAKFTSGTEVSVDGATLEMIAPQISRDSQTLYWFDYGDRKIYAATRGINSSTFITRRAVVGSQVTRFAVSADELTLYYSDAQDNDIFRSTRSSKDIAFPTGVPLANVNSGQHDGPLAVTDDDCVLFMTSDRPGLGGYDVWIARRPN